MLEYQNSTEQADFPTALEQAKTQSKLSQKVIRVFFSSPFGGLELERELLTKNYWPQLQSLCSHHGYTFVPVDLRWGITSDLSASASTINICLSEIDRSDIFVGFFGQRYGWHGDDKLLQKTFDFAQSKYPWLSEYRGKAVTELEFLHGHLRNPGYRPACFYFRDKEYDDKMFAHYQSQGNERETRKFCSATDGPHAAELLEDLKQRVYATRDKAAKMMFNAVHNEIQKMLNSASDVHLDERSVEKAKHDAYFVKQYAIGGKYVGGDEYLSKIDDLFSAGSGEACNVVVSGNAGSGKTALLCNWIDQHSKKSPKDIIVYHFIGCANDTTGPKQILSRIYNELKHEFEKTSEKNEVEPNIKTDKGQSDVLQVKPETNTKKNIEQTKTLNSKEGENRSSGSSSSFFSCFRGSKVHDENNVEVYEEPKTKEEPSEPATLQTEREEKKDAEEQRQDQKFSPKNLLPTKDGGTMSIQKLLADITKLSQRISEAKRKVFLIIDALNKTDALGKTGKILYWLPKGLPSNIHLIVLTRTEDTASMKVLVEERSYDTVDISSLDDSEKETMAKNMLKLRGKEFSEKQMQKVVASEQTRNPLYLKIFLEEMCNFGDFFQVDKQIDHLLDAESTKVLFLKFIKRLEMDYNPKADDDDQCSGNVVRDMLCLIEVSHEGMSEEELRSILNIDSHVWSPIFFAMASFILDRAGLYSFAYEDLSKAVNEYYLQLESDRLKFVQKLSNYFETKFESLYLSVDNAVPSRISSELPRLLAQLNDSEGLASYLTKLCVMASVVCDSPEWFNMIEYWNISEYSNEQISEAFCASIDDEVKQLETNDLEKYGEQKNPIVTHEKLLPVVLRIASFMVDAGFGKATIPILKKAKQLYDSVEDTHGDLQFVEYYCNINYQLACLYVDLDTLDEAEPLHQEVLRERERYLDQFSEGSTNIATSLHGLAVLYDKRRDYEKVNEYYQKIIDIYQKVPLPPDHEYYGNTYNNWGVSIMSNNTSGDPDVYKKAIEYLNKAQKIYEIVYFGHLPPQVTVTLNNLALCYRRQGNHDEARKIYQRILGIRLETLGENHVDVGMVYRNLGTLELAEKKLELALDYYTKSLNIYQAFGGEDHVETALSLENMAMVNIYLKRWDEAHNYFSKAGEILHKIEKMDHSLAFLNSTMADYYLNNNREQDAYKLFERLVGTAIATPRDYAALEYFDRQLPENERPTRPYEHTTEFALEKWPGNAMLLGNKIKYLSETGNIDKLMEYLTKTTCSADTYLSAYSAFVEKGHTAVAMPLLKDGLEHYPDNQYLLRNMVELSMAFKDYDKVIECSTRLLTLGPTELFPLIFLGRAQACTGDVATAKETFSKGLTLAQEANDDENSAQFQNFLKLLEELAQ